MEININKDNFKSEVLDCEGTVIVDFFATWCMPCKMLAPIAEKVAEDNGIKLAKVNIDDNEELVKEFGIFSVPTLKIFRNGKEVNSSVGLLSENQLLELIK